MTDVLAPLEDLLGKSSESEFNSASVGLESSGLLGGFFVRDLNSWLIGRCQIHPNISCDCEISRPTICGCGNSVSETGSVMIEDRGSHLSVRPLATCGSKWACDFCAPRASKEDRAVSEWLFQNHLDAGGTLALLSLTCSHHRGSSLKDQLDLLEVCRQSLFSSTAFKSLGVVGSMRFIDITYSPGSGWHGHLHVSLFLPAGFDRFDEMGATLGPIWNNRLEKKGARGGAYALEVTETVSMRQAMYPHKDVPDDASPFDVDKDGDFEVSDFEVGNFEVGDFGNGMSDSIWDSLGKRKGGLSPWELAYLAACGDRRAQALWIEYYEGTKGRAVVSRSKDLRDSWKARAGEEEDSGQPDKGVPVALVSSDLWARAHRSRRRSLAQAGINICRSEGVASMARFWSDHLGLEIVVGEVDDLPFVYLCHSVQPVKELSNV